MDHFNEIRQMKFEHIDLQELIITRESLKQTGLSSTSKASENENNLVNLAIYNFNAVDYSLFPLLDPDTEDGKSIGEDNLIIESLQCSRMGSSIPFDINLFTQNSNM